MFDVFCYLDDCQIVPGYRTDPSGVILKLDFYEQDRGKGYWKFNNLLFKDKNYIKIVQDTTRAVRGSDYSPTIMLSEEKDKFVNEKWKENG